MLRILLPLTIASVFPLTSLQAQSKVEVDDLADVKIPAEAQEREVGYRPSGGIPKKRGYFLGDVLVGERRFYANGKLAEEKIYRDGQLHGYWRQYYENGKLFAARPYREGKPDGTFRFYDERGKLLGTSTLREGTGTLREYPYYRLGSHDAEIPYIDGKVHGIKRSWGSYSLYHRDGHEEKRVDAVYIARYEGGKVNGWSALYDMQGRVIRSGYRQHGEFHGLLRNYDSEGRSVKGWPVYIVNGQHVSREDYLQAAEKDPVLKITLDKDRPDEPPDLKHPQ